MYLPSISDARIAANYAIGPYLGVLLTDCTSSGMINYLYALMVYAVFPDAENTQEQFKPVMAVAAEINNTIQQEQGDRACFLGLFDGQGHRNYGLSTEWADLNTFVERALELTRQELDISEAPRLITE